eukprot:gene8059-9606_t
MISNRQMRDDLINLDVLEIRRTLLPMCNRYQFKKPNNNSNMCQKILATMMRCVCNLMQMTHNKKHRIQTLIMLMNLKNLNRKPNNSKLSSNNPSHNKLSSNSNNLPDSICER